MKKIFLIIIYEMIKNVYLDLHISHVNLSSIVFTALEYHTLYTL